MPSTGESISNTREDRRPNDWSFRPQDELKWQEGKDAGKKEMDNRLGEPSLATTPPPAAEPRGEATPADDKSKFYAIWKTQDLTAAVAQAPSSAPDPFVAGLQQNASARKVIRNGSMQFEVDRFDDALMRITRLVVEQGGFVATTDSDKLPNGHVKGTITLRVPPEHMDSLVLTLRGIGDLKSQKIGAEDVTKHYTDLESELRAARAMQDRLLDIIKTGKGQIKDLLEAEKQLGVWREKIEQIEGEKRYLDNQIALSTLVVELYERDIQTPSFASETELVNMSLETEKVDDAYEKARSAIEIGQGADCRRRDETIRCRPIWRDDPGGGPAGRRRAGHRPPPPARWPDRPFLAAESKRTTQNSAAPQTGITTVHREDVLVSSNT